uniref:Magnesium transporter NIPA2 n=3 Tax=Clastoptera arizonana TaxID=38151 RepID=A0A1B6D9M1_9HEMI
MSNISNFSKLYNERDFYIGLGLAISSSLFIGSSFIIKKIALIRLSRNGSIRAGSGGFGYLKEWIWWAGLLSMGVGEAANFAAYAFAPASLVTPLGALSVLVAAVLASKFLGEGLNLLGKIGCFLCILGSTIIVLHSPKEEEIESMDILLERLKEPGFVIYALIVMVVSVEIMVYIGPKYGHKNVCIFLILCSSVGSLTVMACKGLGLALKETFTGTKNEITNSLTWGFLILVIIFITVQMNYLNRALDLFNTGVVTPVYYVMFTTLVITASAILFKEWVHLSYQVIIGILVGFVIIVISIILLTTLKDKDITLNDVKRILQQHSKVAPSINSSLELDIYSIISNNKKSFY